MRVEIESENTSIPEMIRRRLKQDVRTALEQVQTEAGRFVVNDTLWFWKNPAGAVRPTVVNSAGFISKGFQNELEKLGWEKEPTIKGQNFDAMTSFEVEMECYSIPEERFIPVLSELKEQGFSEYGLQATSLYRNFVHSSTPFFPAEYIPFVGLFERARRSYRLRVGLEFETGNIASSFRAIEKLQGLFDSGDIDIGVFVTSKSKADGAARIWPVSNRNGSFEELNQRRYDARRSYPHIDLSFRPDEYCRDAKYLAEEGLYEMVLTGEAISISGKEYMRALNPRGEEKLIPIQTPT